MYKLYTRYRACALCINRSSSPFSIIKPVIYSRVIGCLSSALIFTAVDANETAEVRPRKGFRGPITGGPDYNRTLPGARIRLADFSLRITTVTRLFGPVTIPFSTDHLQIAIVIECQ